MTWLTPLTGAIAAAVVIPPLVALYFLRLRRRRREISSTLLWRRSVEDLEANAPWQRLRPNLLLLLQLLVLLALVAAVAQPIAQAGGRSGRTVILIDRSGSMRAADEADGASRLDLAKAQATARVEQVLGGGWLGGGDGEVMVIAFDDRAEVRSPFSANARQALEAIAAIEPADGESRLLPALELARAFATTTDPDAPPEAAEAVALELFSDGRLADLDTTVLRKGESLRFEPVGAAGAGNIGFEVAAAERPIEGPGSIAVFASLFNTGNEAVSARVSIAVDGVVRAVLPEPVEIPAAKTGDQGEFQPGRASVSFLPFEQPRDALIELAIVPNTDSSASANLLATDDRAAIVVPPPKRLRVLRVGGRGGVLGMLLEGLPLERLESISVAEFEEAGAEATAGYDVVVLDGAAPASLPAGRYLAFGATAPIEGFDDFGSRDGALVRSMRSEHEIFRNVNLDELSVASWRLIAPGRDVAVLAEAAAGPLILFADRGPVKVIQVAFDPLDSNWPLLRSFVNFTANAIEHLGSIDEAASLAGLVPGDTITAMVPPGVASVALRLPDGASIELGPGLDGAVAWGPIRHAGVHELSWTRNGREERRRVAVNRLGAEEGRVDPAASLMLGDEVVGGEAGATGRLDLWPWLLGVGLVLLFLEWIVYQRRAAP